MKRNTGKILCAFLGLAILLTATGCGGSNPAEGKNSAVSGETAKPVTLTVMMHGVNQMTGVQDDPVTKEVAKETGITISVISDSGMDLNTQLSALIASDDLPDIVYANTPEQRNLLMNSDQVIPLDNLMATHGKNIAGNKYGAQTINFSKNFFSKDGKLYYVLLDDGLSYQAGYPMVAPYIRWDIYKAIGAPPVKDMNDLLSVLKKMQDAYPKTSDGKKVYAISGCLADPSWNTFSLTAAEAFMGFRKLDNYGLAGTYVYDKSQYVNAMATADSPTWTLFKFFNKAFQMGILDPDAATMKYDQWKEKLDAGQVYYTPFSWFAGLPVMNDPNKLFLPVKFENFVNDSFTCDYATPTGGGYSYAISKKCKNPERALDLLNFVWSYDGAYLMANGVKGVNWNLQNNVPTLTDQYVKDFKAGKVKAPLFQSFTGPLMDDRTNTPINLMNSIAYFEKYETSNPMVQDYLKTYNVSVPVQVFEKAKYHTWDGYSDALAPYPSDLKDIDSNLQDYILTNMPKIVLAKSDAQFESMRTKIVKDTNSMGAQKLFDFRKPDYDKTQSKLNSINQAQ